MRVKFLVLGFVLGFCLGIILGASWVIHDLEGTYQGAIDELSLTNQVQHEKYLEVLGKLEAAEAIIKHLRKWYRPPKGVPKINPFKPNSPNQKPKSEGKINAILG